MRTKASGANARHSSPGVQRVVAILDFFADHSKQSFTLADLVRALKLRRSTCHALLGGLLEAGYVYRTRDGAYIIGPRLLAVGSIATENFSLLQVAEPEMRELADEFDAICAAVEREGDWAVVRARAASVSHLGLSIPQGTRIPLRPPMAASIFAWAPAEGVSAWLDALLPAAGPEQRSDMMAAMAFAREHGFVFGRRLAPLAQASPERAYLGPVTAVLLTAEASLNRDESYELAYVLAPIFNLRGEVAWMLGFTQPTGQYSGARIEQMGQQLREACGRISVFARLSNLP